MTANTITYGRVILTFLVITILGIHHKIDIVLIPTIATIFVLDALDGYIARKQQKTSKSGEVLDTVADRIIENTFYFYFTMRGTIPLWMPIVVMTRGVITDALQHYGGYPKSGWAHAISRSRISRALSGITKMITFTALASAQVFKEPILEQVSFILAIIAVSYCILRGFPFLFLDKKT